MCCYNESIFLSLNTVTIAFVDRDWHVWVARSEWSYLFNIVVSYKFVMRETAKWENWELMSTSQPHHNNLIDIVRNQFKLISIIDAESDSFFCSPPIFFCFDTRITSIIQIFQVSLIIQNSICFLKAFFLLAVNWNTVNFRWIFLKPSPVVVGFSNWFQPFALHWHEARSDAMARMGGKSGGKFSN